MQETPRNYTPSEHSHNQIKTSDYVITLKELAFHAKLPYSQLFNFVQKLSTEHQLNYSGTTWYDPVEFDEMYNTALLDFNAVRKLGRIYNEGKDYASILEGYFIITEQCQHSTQPPDELIEIYEFVSDDLQAKLHRLLNFKKKIDHQLRTATAFHEDIEVIDITPPSSFANFCD